MSVVGENSLRAPIVPNIEDIDDADRALREQAAKIVELQTIVRALVAAVIALGGSV